MKRLGAMVFLVVLGGVGRAHEISASVLDVAVHGEVVDVSLGVHAHVVDLLVGADADEDGWLTAEELGHKRDPIDAWLREHLIVSADGARCEESLAGATPTRRGGAQIEARYRCPASVRQLAIDNAAVFEALPEHTFIGTLREADGRAFQLRFDQGAPRLAHAVGGASELPSASVGSLLGEYVVLGVEHIIGGLDHLLFVLTLVIVARRLKDLVWLITSFTLAHSVTLTLGALDVVTLPPSFVEPAIALTILAVCALNVMTRGERPHKPWLVFLFGLLHGFGFAGALAETGLPQANVGWALGAFNVGVELGQIACVMVLWPLVLLLAKRKVEWYRWAVPASSAVVGVLAIFWFVERVQA